MSENVDKVLQKLQMDPVLSLEFALVCTKLESEAGVKLTKEERKEFFKELSRMVTQEVLAVWA